MNEAFRAVILLNGGLDSATILTIAKARGFVGAGVDDPLPTPCKTA